MRKFTDSKLVSCVGLMVLVVGFVAILQGSPAVAAVRPIQSNANRQPGEGTSRSRLSSQNQSQRAALSAHSTDPPADAGMEAQATWTPIGPSPVLGLSGSPGSGGEDNSGRIDDLAVSGNGPSATLFAGSPGGGVWRSLDGGQTWANTTDNLTFPDMSTGVAIGALATDPTDPGLVYAGTGDPTASSDGFASDGYGEGVLKSTDNGSTWTLKKPPLPGCWFHALTVDPNVSNGDRVFAATTCGFFLSTDGGNTWTTPTGSDAGIPVTAIAIDPSTSPTTVFYSQITEGIKVSTDGGRTFRPIGRGLPPAADFGLTSLGIGTNDDPVCAIPQPSNADQTLYAAIQLNASSDPSNHTDMSVYESTDGGADWSLQQTPNYADADGPNQDQSWYDNAIAVDPCNVNHVIAGGENLIQSTDFGSSWSQVDPVHEDTHSIVFENDGAALIGDDGGVYELDQSDNVDDLNNQTLDDTLVYPTLGLGGVGGDQVVEVTAGLQDNGTEVDSDLNSFPNLGWNNINGGDGGNSVVDPDDYKLQLVESDGQLCLTTDNWTNPTFECDTDQSPPGSNCAPLPWTDCEMFAMPMAMTNNSSNQDQPTVYFGGSDLWEGVVNHNAVSWENNSPILESPSGLPVSAIGVPPDDPNGGVSPNVVWVGFEDGALEMSTDTQDSPPRFIRVPLISAANGQPLEEDISDIAVNPTDPDTAVVLDGPQVEMVSANGSIAISGANITGNLPYRSTINSVLYDNGLLLAATDEGIFFTDPTDHAVGQPWDWDPIGGPQSPGSGLPNVQVTGLDEFDGQTFATTWGRGVWALSSLNQTSNVQINTTSLDDASYGERYQAKLTASGGEPGTACGGYTWSLAPGSKPLPSGFGLSTCGEISGSPNQTGTFTFTVQAEDSWGYTTTQTESITVVQVSVSNATLGWTSDWSPVNTPVTLQAHISPSLQEADARVTFSVCPPATQAGQPPSFNCTDPFNIGTVDANGNTVDSSPSWKPTSAWIGDVGVTATYTSLGDPDGTSGLLRYTVFNPGYPILRDISSCGTTITADWYVDPRQPQPPVPQVNTADPSLSDKIAFSLNPPLHKSPDETAFTPTSGDIEAEWIVLPATGVTTGQNYTISTVDENSASGVEPFSEGKFAVESPVLLCHPMPTNNLLHLQNLYLNDPLSKRGAVVINPLSSSTATQDNLSAASLNVVTKPLYGTVKVVKGGTCKACVGSAREFQYTPGKKAAPGLTDSFTYEVSDLQGQTAKTAMVTIGFGPPRTPAIASAARTNFTEGAAGSFTVATIGDPIATVSERGSLPSGVSFVDRGNGSATLSGLPAPETSGSYPLTITASNGIGTAARQSLVLTVKTAEREPTFTSVLSGSFSVGAKGSFMLKTAGTPTPTITETGLLPTGVGFVDNGNGTAFFSGTPAAGTTGTYPLSITASNGIGGPVSRSFMLTVNPSTGSPGITSQEVASFVKGIAGSFTVTTTGSPTAQISEAGSLPAGLSFTDNGKGTATISGTPLVGRGGGFPIPPFLIKITASNGIDPAATQTLRIFDNLATATPPAITSTASATFKVGTDNSFTVASTGDAFPSLSEEGNLPTGVSFTDNADGTATISGSPASGTTGTYPISIVAQNNVGSAVTQAFVLGVIDVPSSPTGVTATAHNTSATITFNPPANDGDSAVTGYTVTATDTTSPANGGQMVSGTGSPIAVSGLTNGDSYTFTVSASNAAGTGPASTASSAVSPQPVVTIIGDGSCGYWTIGGGGLVSNFGCAWDLGSMNEPLSTPIVAAAATPDGGGYWLVASNGGIFNYGDANYYGAPSSVSIVAISASSDGKGYWLFGSSGKVYNYGDATPLASPPVNLHIVAAAATPDGGGYWLVASNGGIFNYGDATDYGSPNTSVAGISATSDGDGYWLVGSNGTIYAYGDAISYGDLSGSPSYPVVGMASTSDRKGYWLVDSNGDISAFGDAQPSG